MTKLIRKYKSFFSNKKLVTALAIALVILVASLVVNYFAALYAADRESNAVTDIVLSNIPVFDVDYTFVYGPIIFWIFIAGILLHDPRRLPFAIKSIALFVLVRSVFITLTHIGPFPDQIVLDTWTPSWLHAISSSSNFFIFSSGGDLFFSGHTGLPFLMALIFKDNRLLRNLCIFAAIFFGVVVLLGHLHYSIDVLSAFFITYSIYHLSLWMFKKDKLMFDDTKLDIQSITSDII